MTTGSTQAKFFLSPFNHLSRLLLCSFGILELPFADEVESFSHPFTALHHRALLKLHCR